MSEFFTRETWRAGKKSRLRKRRKPYGGRKIAPAAFLEAAKKTQFRAGPVVAFVALLDAMDAPVDDWL
jgi:hypothetical protein